MISDVISVSTNQPLPILGNNKPPASDTKAVNSSKHLFFNVLEEDCYLESLIESGMADSTGKIDPRIAHSFELSLLKDKQLLNLQNLLDERINLSGEDTAFPLKICVTPRDILKKNLSFFSKKSPVILFCGGALDTILEESYYEENLMRFLSMYRTDNWSWKNNFCITSAFREKIKQPPIDIDFRISQENTSNWICENSIDSILETLEQKTINPLPEKTRIYSYLKSKQADSSLFKQSSYIQHIYAKYLLDPNNPYLYRFLLEINAFHKAENILIHTQKGDSSKVPIHYSIRSLHDGKVNWDFVYPISLPQRGVFPFHSLGIFLDDLMQVEEYPKIHPVATCSNVLQCVSDKNARLITGVFDKYEDIGAIKIYFGAITQGYRCRDEQIESQLTELILSYSKQKGRSLSDVLSSFVIQWSKNHWKNNPELMIALAYNYSIRLFCKGKEFEEQIDDLWNKLYEHIYYVIKVGDSINDQFLKHLMKALVKDKISFSTIHNSIAVCSYLALHSTAQKRIFPTQHGKNIDGSGRGAIQFRAKKNRNLNDLWTILFPYEPETEFQKFLKRPMPNEQQEFINTLLNVFGLDRTPKESVSRFSSCLDDPLLKMKEIKSMIPQFLESGNLFLFNFGMRILIACKDKLPQTQLQLLCLEKFCEFILKRPPAEVKNIKTISLLKQCFYENIYQNLFVNINQFFLSLKKMYLYPDKDQIRERFTLIKRLLKNNNREINNLVQRLRTQIGAFPHWAERKLLLTTIKSELTYDIPKALLEVNRAKSNASYLQVTKLRAFILILEKIITLSNSAEKSIYLQNITNEICEILKKPFDATHLKATKKDQMAQTVIRLIDEQIRLNHIHDGIKLYDLLIKSQLGANALNHHMHDIWYKIFNVIIKKDNHFDVEFILEFCEQAEKNGLWSAFKVGEKLKIFRELIDNLLENNNDIPHKVYRFIFLMALNEQFDLSPKLEEHLINHLINQSNHFYAQTYLNLLIENCTIKIAPSVTNILLQVIKTSQKQFKNKNLPIIYMESLAKLLTDNRFSQSISTDDQKEGLRFILKGFQQQESLFKSPLLSTQIYLNNIFSLLNHLDMWFELATFTECLKNNKIPLLGFSICLKDWLSKATEKISLKSLHHFESIEIILDVFKLVLGNESDLIFREMTGKLHLVLADKHLHANSPVSAYKQIQMANVYEAAKTQPLHFDDLRLDLSIKLIQSKNFEAAFNLINAPWNLTSILRYDKWKYILDYISENHHFRDVLEQLFTAQKYIDILSLDNTFTTSLIESLLPKQNQANKKNGLKTNKAISETVLQQSLILVQYLSSPPYDIWHNILQNISLYGSISLGKQAFSAFLENISNIKVSMHYELLMKCWLSALDCIKKEGHEKATLLLKSKSNLLFVYNHTYDAIHFQIIQKLCFVCLKTISQSKNEDKAIEYKTFFDKARKKKIFPFIKGYIPDVELISILVQAACKVNEETGILTALEVVIRMIADTQLKELPSEIPSLASTLICKINRNPNLSLQIRNQAAILLSFNHIFFKLPMDPLESFKCLNFVTEFHHDKGETILDLIDNAKNLRKRMTPEIIDQMRGVLKEFLTLSNPRLNEIGKYYLVTNRLENIFYNHQEKLEDHSQNFNVIAPKGKKINDFKTWKKTKEILIDRGIDHPNEEKFMIERTRKIERCTSGQQFKVFMALNLILLITLYILRNESITKDE